SVVAGPEGALQTMAPNSMFIDHTTASAQIAQELYQTAAARNVSFVDAPVSGGQAGAQNGVLTIMCGGDLPAFQQAEPVLRSYAQAVTLLGGAGTGQLCKMVNQIC